ncbi:hypothetical protein BDF22DRAFT_731655 [Syncephalis plumigaleata]|nr:hypothetical protein BDF22DRAFT_731655 [Syncephalis plumigaleata]
MTRCTSFFGMSICAAVLVALSAVSSVSANGYMSYPPPRGIEKASYKVDDLKSPNTRGVCRGEPVGQITKIDHAVTLQFTITKPHTGMCSVYIMDPNLGNARKIASKMNCASHDMTGSWGIIIPSDIKGRKVLRWTWEADHMRPQIEHFEQCADVQIEGSSAGHRRRNHRRGYTINDDEEVTKRLQRRNDEVAPADNESSEDDDVEADTANAGGAEFVTTDDVEADTANAGGAESASSNGAAAVAANAAAAESASPNGLHQQIANIS